MRTINDCNRAQLSTFLTYSLTLTPKNWYPHIAQILLLILHIYYKCSTIVTETMYITTIWDVIWQCCTPVSCAFLLNKAALNWIILKQFVWHILYLHANKNTALHIPSSLQGCVIMILKVPLRYTIRLFIHYYNIQLWQVYQLLSPCNIPVVGCLLACSWRYV